MSNIRPHSLFDYSCDKEITPENHVNSFMTEPNNINTPLLSNLNSPLIQHNTILDSPIFCTPGKNNPIHSTNWRSSTWMITFVVFMAILTDIVVYGVVLPILPRILLSVGVDQSEIDVTNGTLFALYAVGLFVATPIFGVVSDKFQNRTTPMILGLGAMGLCSLVFVFGDSLHWLYVARIAQGVSAAASWVVGLALLADTVPLETLGTAMGIVMSGSTLGYLVGPLIGGLMGQYVSIHSPFYVCFGLSAFDLLGRLIIKPKKLQQDPTTNHKKVSLANILCHLQIILFLIATLLVSCSVTAMEALISIHLTETFNTSESENGFMIICMIIPNVVMSLVIGKFSDKYPRHSMVTFGMVFHALMIPWTAISPSIPLQAVSLMLFGLSASCMNTPCMPEMSAIGMREDWENANAQIYAVYNAAYSGGMFLGPLLAPLIKVRSSFFWAMTFWSILLLAFSPIFYFMNSGYLKTRTSRITRLL